MRYLRPTLRKALYPFLMLAWLICSFHTVLAEEVTTDFDSKILRYALACRNQVATEFNRLISNNKLTLSQMMDTFYIPIPNTNPQKYRTQYDRHTDEIIRIILDRYLAMDKRIKFVVAVDRNGYLPTHNSIYSKPLTGDADYDIKNNRTKRMFSDRTGLAAARNQKAHLLQSYSRDTGEKMMDLSVPIFVKEMHWGAIRIGYQQ